MSSTFGCSLGWRHGSSTGWDGASPYLCLGYLGEAGPLRNAPDGFATVGDRGNLTGGVLAVAGRGDAAVPTGGATVLVEDVERVLRRAVDSDVVVVGVPHSGLGQVVPAVLTDPSELVRPGGRPAPS